MAANNFIARQSIQVTINIIQPSFSQSYDSKLMF